MNADIRAANDFIKTSAGDLRSGLKEISNMEDEIDRRWAGYKFQQSIEKALKAIILCKDSSIFEAKHSTTQLLDNVRKFDVIDLSDDDREITLKIDKDFTKFRYPEAGDEIKEQNVILYKEFAEMLLPKAKNFVLRFIPKYLEVFPKFDDDEFIEKLKKWKDISNSEDEMPSFEYKNKKSGDIYKIFVNFEDHELRKKEWEDNKRFRLLKNGKEISLANSLDYIIHEFKADLKRNDTQSPGGR